MISWTQLQTIDNLFGYDSGTGLIRKLVLFAILLVVAGANKWWLTPALERGEATAATCDCAETISGGWFCGRHGGQRQRARHANGERL